MTKPIAIQFGAGNIGRGFIGLLLSQAGYEVVFVDVAEPLVEAINQHGQYPLKEVIDHQERLITVENVKAINGKAEAEVIEAISRAQLVTTAVGPNILPIVARVIAQGLQHRAQLNLAVPLNLIACENLIDNSTVLRQHVFSHLPAGVKTYVENHTGFPCCVIDCMVTNPSEAEQQLNPLLVVTEGQGLWIVDRAAFVGQPPDIARMKLTDNMDAAMEQKIFTLNTAHAVSGYLGYLKGYLFVHQALRDPEIRRVVMGALEESSAALVKRHQLDPQAQAQYVADTLQRFANEAMPDPIIRVIREPKRKLAPNDRLIKPALLALEAGVTPTNLATAIAAALLYDYPDDPQAVELSKQLQTQGSDRVLAEVSNLAADTALARMVKAKLPEVNNLRQQTM